MEKSLAGTSSVELKMLRDFLGDLSWDDSVS
jgi:hypothetical protein